MFVVGKPVIDDNFFDRSSMLSQVNNLISSKQDFMIKAPRRFGKTSLIKQALKDERHIYLDIRRVPNISVVPNEIIEKVYEISGIYGITQKIKENVVNFLSSIKASVKIDYEIVQASAEYLSSKKDTSVCEDLIFSLDTVEKIGKSLGKTITIVFDEFQDIKRFSCEGADILEVLRGNLQHYEYVHCIFLGSIETIMNDIFENKKSPFFNYCRKLKLDAFNIEELMVEVIDVFDKKDISIDKKDEFKSFLETLQGHPANTMIVLQNLYFICLENSLSKVTKKELDLAYENGYFEMMDLVEQYIIQIKQYKHYHDVLYRMANDQEQLLTNQALHQVKTGLLNMGYLSKESKGEYKIIDNFLVKYLQSS